MISAYCHYYFQLLVCHQWCTQSQIVFDSITFPILYITWWQSRQSKLDWLKHRQTDKHQWQLEQEKERNWMKIAQFQLIYFDNKSTVDCIALKLSISKFLVLTNMHVLNALLLIYRRMLGFSKYQFRIPNEFWFLGILNISALHHQMIIWWMNLKWMDVPHVKHQLQCKLF